MRFLLIFLWGIMPFADLFASEQQITFNSALSAKWTSNILKGSLSEPSGIVYHPRRKTLFVVSDDGYISEISLKGKILKNKFVDDADMEGIPVDPKTGLLYVAIEGDEIVLEIAPNELTILRTFNIERVYQERMILPEGGNGIESITFVPNADHGEGGTFFVGNQVVSYKVEEKSYIAEIELPLRSKSNLKGKIKNVFLANINDISGMQYLHQTNRIGVISDLQNIYAEISLDGKVIKEFALPGYDQEGITLDEEGNIYLAIDGDGGVLDAVMKIIPYSH